jgi:hypothetical protein
MRKIILRTMLVCALSCSALMANAFNFPPWPGDHGGGGNHHDAPLDGGASLLIGAGIVYGIKKAYNSRKKATK